MNKNKLKMAILLSTVPNIIGIITYYVLYKVFVEISPEISLYSNLILSIVIFALAFRTLFDLKEIYY